MQWIGKIFFKFGLDVNFFLKGVVHDKVHLKLKVKTKGMPFFDP